MTRVLVYGPESTRSRYVARLCAQILGCTKEYDGLDEVAWGKHLVVHRSLPHGDRDRFERVADLVDEFAIGRVVLTSRTRAEAVKSAAVRHHAGDVDAAALAWDTALCYVQTWTGSAFLFSSDACEVVGWERVVSDLSSFLGRSVDLDTLEPWRASA